MTMKIRPFAAITLLLASALPTGASEPPSSRPPIAGVNIRVSQGTLPYVEPVVAVDPDDPTRLFGAAMAIRQPDGRGVVTAFTSEDGGVRWQASVPPEQEALEGADPQVAFTPEGTALLTSVVSGDDALGNYAPSLHLYRSTDGGGRFEPAAIMQGNYDHEKLVVDPATGHVHIAAMALSRLEGSRPEEQRGLYQLVLFSSNDDGRTLSGPRPILDGGGDIGVNVLDLVVADGGRLVVFYTEFAYSPEPGGPRTSSALRVVWSDDEGASWSTPVDVGAQCYGPTTMDPLNIVSPSEPTFAQAASPTESRLLAAWTSFIYDDPRQRILISRSRDGGASWSAAEPVDQSLDSDALMPTLASGPEGRVALMWLASSDGTSYDVMVAAAPGPGAPFSRPARVTSAPSTPARGTNLLPFATAIRSPRGTFVFTQSTFARYPYGGDYAGLAIGSDGAAHAFWPDSRGDGFEI